MWFECAPGCEIVDNKIVQATPPSTDQVQEWIGLLASDQVLKSEVFHRFILTKGNCKSLASWSKRQFFFRNATPEQLSTISSIMEDWRKSF
jgi:hypothetical protein